jgi:hypothetical protein
MRWKRPWKRGDGAGVARARRPAASAEVENDAAGFLGRPCTAQHRRNQTRLVGPGLAPARPPQGVALREAVNLPVLRTRWFLVSCPTLLFTMSARQGPPHPAHGGAGSGCPVYRARFLWRAITAVAFRCLEHG